MTNPLVIAFCGVGGIVGKNDGTVRMFNRQPGTSLQSMLVGIRSEWT